MLKIGITQRVDHIENYDEKRDCLDQRWYHFFLELDILPIPLPNIKTEYVPNLINTLNLDAILLSGGNSIYSLDKNAKDASIVRDNFETALFKEAIKRDLKIIGVCRGMQMINIIMDGTLSKVRNHVAVKHKLVTLLEENIFSKEVNSYHNWGIREKELSKNLQAIAYDEQKNIEAFINKEKSILGIMWHPEREEPFNQKDINLIKEFLCKQEL